MFDIADALKNFCAEHDGQMNFYPGYSGRGMYGKKCPAIVVNDDAQPFHHSRVFGRKPDGLYGARLCPLLPGCKLTE